MSLPQSFRHLPKQEGGILADRVQQLTPLKPVDAGKRPRVVVVGGGFGGLQAARSLKKLPVDVTVIDRRNFHAFQPLLYQVALAVLSPADIARPIRIILRHHANAEVLMDEVVGIDTARKTVQLKSGATTAWDYLVLATGSTHSYFGHDDWAPIAPGLKTLEDAIEIRRRVLLAFELAERHMVEHGWHPPLNFVVIGGGPTGVELAGAISDIAHLYMKRDFRHIDPTKSVVMLLDGGPSILATYPADLSAKAEATLERLHVEVRTNTRVSGVEPGWVEAEGPKGKYHIESAVTLWAAGVEASPLGKMLGVPPDDLDRRGCVIVDESLNPAGLKNVFILGDLAHFEQDGKQIPGVAQPAIQMGNHVAKLIGADLAGRPRPPFRYFDKGDMATVGRMNAIADVKWPFHRHMSGFFAWITWATVHIFFLIGFRNRLAVATNWVWNFLTFSRGVRLITGDQNLPGWKEELKAGPNAGQGGGAKAAD
jgi:NADH:ubiquinone reductase (H+-translocating)